MERVATAEERIRRAEEIYYRRKAQGVRVSGDSVSVGRSKRVSLGRKMAIQILVCLCIYVAIQVANGYKNIFSENVINQVDTMLSYDVNFLELYNQFSEYFNKNFNIINSVHSKNENEGDGTFQGNSEENGTVNSYSDNEKNNEASTDSQNAEVSENVMNIQNVENSEATETMQNAVDMETDESSKNTENSKTAENLTNTENLINTEENSILESETTTQTPQNAGNDGTQKAKVDAENEAQMNEDAEYIKQNYNIIQPVQGRITSGFGSREETEIVSAFHQGVDISANTGTPIHSAMEGTVVAASYAGDYIPKTSSRAIL